MAPKLSPRMWPRLQRTRSSIPDGEAGEYPVFTLRGKTSVAFLLALLLAAGFNAIHTRPALSGPESAILERALATYYAQILLRDVQADTLSPDASRALAERLDRSRRVTLVSVTAKGWGRSKVVRADIRVDGSDPPDGRPIRYLQLEGGAVSRISSLKYRLGFWFVDATLNLLL